MKQILCSKIHNAIVTDSNINYIGSITIDKELMKKSGIWENEKVMVVSNSTGVRIETYVIPEKEGAIEINGAAANLIKKGEEVIIMAFEITNKKIELKVILVDKKNKFVKFL